MYLPVLGVIKVTYICSWNARITQMWLTRKSVIKKELRIDFFIKNFFVNHNLKSQKFQFHSEAKFKANFESQLQGNLSHISAVLKTRAIISGREKRTTKLSIRRTPHESRPGYNIIKFDSIAIFHGPFQLVFFVINVVFRKSIYLKLKMQNATTILLAIAPSRLTSSLGLRCAGLAKGISGWAHLAVLLQSLGSRHKKMKGRNVDSKQQAKNC